MLMYKKSMKKWLELIPLLLIFINVFSYKMILNWYKTSVITKLLLYWLPNALYNVFCHILFKHIMTLLKNIWNSFNILTSFNMSKHATLVSVFNMRPRYINTFLRYKLYVQFMLCLVATHIAYFKMATLAVFSILIYTNKITLTKLQRNRIKWSVVVCLIQTTDIASYLCTFSPFLILDHC